MDILNLFYTNDLWRLALIAVSGLAMWKFVLKYNPKIKKSDIDKKRLAK